jgi:hypothetical protein
VHERQQDLEQHRFMTLGEMVDELGRMIGGWIVKTRKQQGW